VRRFRQAGRPWRTLTLLLLELHLVDHVTAQVVIGLGAQRMKSKAARKRACSTRLNGVLPTRFSKRGCISQISRMSAGQLAATRDIANAGVENLVNRVLQRRVSMLTLPVALAQPSRTSAHSTQASRKLGATGLPSPTRGRCPAALHSQRAALGALRTTTSSSG
jgi:hypothetical protein